MIETDQQPNRLINQKSPYLLQHAYNPIDWYAWNEEALNKAKKEDKPIFLSIGYSTCHWCHVMERESFEDQEVAEIMNNNFIPIKVDREERPDIDHMYMTYCQILTGAGGWPLTVLLTPDKQPFFTGTYFPKHSQYGRPGIMDVLSQVAELWKNEKDKVVETAAELYDVVTDHYQNKKKLTADTRKSGIALAKESQEDSIFVWGKEVITKGYTLMEQSFDHQYGGFGNAPKFPSPHNLGFLMRHSTQQDQSKALEMVEKTLASMADGGIYDHIGYGFARYSTDRHWLVPHFEKMLYDNAGLAFVYLEAYQLTKKERYGQIAQEIFQYILRDMTSAEGSFYSAEDADSEGEEGKFYVWSNFEIRKILLNSLADVHEGKTTLDISEQGKTVITRFLDQREKIFDIYCEAYGINEEGNYEGKSIPSKIYSVWPEIAQRHNLDIKEMEELLRACNEIIFLEREKRIHPFKDDKILVSWNGLMIAALAKAAQVFASKETDKNQRDKYILAAEKAAMFIMEKMFNNRGRLLARYREENADYLGYLDDYAFMIYGLLELYTACGKPEYLQQALMLQEEQERLFRDDINGGYYFTGSDAEELLLRPKETYDGAMPSGNSISAYNLARIWKITGENKWQELAEIQINFFKSILEDYPPGYTAFLQALQFFVGEGEELVLAGPLESERIAKMQGVFFEEFRPSSVVVYNDGTIQQTISRMRDYPVEDKGLAYLCRNFACRQPVSEAEKLKKLLAE